VSIQKFINDVAAVRTSINRCPEGQAIQYYRSYDYFFFARIPGRCTALCLCPWVYAMKPPERLGQLFPVSDAIQATNGGDAVFRLDPGPGETSTISSPASALAGNPKTRDGSWLRFLTGGTDSSYVGVTRGQTTISLLIWRKSWPLPFHSWGRSADPG